MREDKNNKKSIYFVILILLFIALGLVITIHYNNKTLVNINDDKKEIKDSDIGKIEEVKEEIKNIDTNKTINITKINRVKTKKNNSNKYDMKKTIKDDNNIFYTYNLSNEINNKDIIISTEININKTLENMNIIKLYDISLYNDKLSLKSVKNTSITIKIPAKNILNDYENIKIVYINDNKIIEEYNTSIYDDYIEFTTNHLSTYGIVGTKKVNIDDIDIEVYKNGKLIINDNNYVSKNDLFDIKLDKYVKNYKIYYALTNDLEFIDFQELKNDLFSNLDATKKYNLLIKLVINNEYKIYDMGTYNIYDIVYSNSNNEDNIGKLHDKDGKELKNEDGNDYTYDDKNINNDIVVKKDRDHLDDKAIVKIFGNVYLVEKTDISNLFITGNLVIDTNEDIITKNEVNELDYNNIYSITIKNKEFMLNGIKYTYELINGEIIIKEENNTTSDEIFNDYDKRINDDGLTFVKQN